MYLNYFKKEANTALYNVWADASIRFFAAVLILAVIFLGSPAAFVFAQEAETEESSQQTQTEESQETTVETGDSEENNSVTENEGTEEEGSGSEGEEGEGGGDTIITTGDAVSEGEVINEANTNDTNTNAEPGEEEGETEEFIDNLEDTTGDTTENNENSEEGTATSTSQTGTTTPQALTLELEENGGDEEERSGGGGGSGTNITYENQATTTNSLEVDAGTGDNTATSTDGVAIIDTGTALASANVINVINTNITNSNGFLLLLNALFGSGTFDLRDFDFGWDTSTSQYESLGGGSSCSFSGCGGGTDFNVSATSTATVTNDVVVRSSTGGNTASGDAAAIWTGDAYAGANVVNLINSNFIDSNYLLVALNNFGDFSGDIVFPGLSFFEEYFSTGSGNSGSLTVENSNAATIDNNVDVNANTGDNTATSTEGSLIVTGDANSDANVVNTVNTNLVGGSSILILLRIHGSWSGDVFGLPPGISWAETPYGIQIFSDPDAAPQGGGSTGPQYQSLSVSNNNEATVQNNVEVYALTGENKVEADDGQGMIVTGDANAGANLANIVNTNVVGQNWILAIFNIFGDWTGNISFGRPDLWVGARAESSDNPIRPESNVTFHYTVTNFGDSPATNVVLKNIFNEHLLAFLGEDGDLADDSGVFWDLGTLAPGESREVSYTAQVSNSVAEGETPIELEVEASSLEADNNLEDNSERIAIMAVRQSTRSGGGGSARPGFPYADLHIEKSANVSKTTASSTVDYTVTINNYGLSAYNAALHDFLRDEEGNIVAEQEWALGEIYPDEEITVTYTVEFSADTTPGLYTNSAYVEALDVRSIRNGGDANSDTVKTNVEVVGTELKECIAYLTSYIKRGANNNSAEVTKLQTFLREQEGYTELEVTGTYDSRTEAAVRDFQERYRANVLDPWGIATPTGYVYYTTRKQINELYCAGQAFPLSSEQLAEISTFRNRALGGNEPIDTSNVGVGDDKTHLAREDEDLGLSVDSNARDMIGGAAAALKGDQARGFVDRLLEAFDGVPAWMSRRLDFSDVLTLKR